MDEKPAPVGCDWQLLQYTTNLVLCKLWVAQHQEAPLCFCGCPHYKAYAEHQAEKRAWASRDTPVQMKEGPKP